MGVSQTFPTAFEGLLSQVHRMEVDLHHATGARLALLDPAVHSDLAIQIPFPTLERCLEQAPGGASTANFHLLLF